MDHPVDGVGAEYLLHPLVVADVRLYESVVRGVLDVREIGQIARIGQLVEVDDAVSGVLVYEQAHYMASDEAGAARDQYTAFVRWCHGSLFFRFSMQTFSDSVQCGIRIPKVFFTLVLSSTE